MYSRILSLIGLTLLCCTFNKTSAQDIEEVINFGNLLFGKSEYIAALNEYQRALFFSGKERKSELSKKIADCYFATHDYESAVSMYDSAYCYSTDDSIRIEFRLQKIQCYLAGGNYGYALLKLEDLETESNEYLTRKIEIYKGVSLYGSGRYEEALRIFSGIIEPDDSLKISRLRQLSGEVKKLPRPNPAIATGLSVLVPGSGQMYAGEFKDGANSALLLSTLFYLGMNAQILDFAVVMPFLYRYYMGGIVHANRFAKEKTRQKKYDCYKQLMEIFQETGYLVELMKYDRGKPYSYEFFKDSISDSHRMLSHAFLFYKKHVSSQDVDPCVFYPSCSVYFMKAVEKHGFLEGSLEGFDRLLRCHPFVNKHDYPYDAVTNKFIDDH